MVKLILLFKKIYVFLLFLTLEGLALNFYSKSTEYTKATMLSASNTIVGGVYDTFSSITDYFGLRTENDMLLERIAQLNERIEHYKQLGLDNDMAVMDDPDSEPAKYLFTTASVINNSITRQENYVFLDRGSIDGVEPNMAVITPQGTIVGYVLSTSERFSVAISVLNINFRTGGKIASTDNFGSVYWDGRDHDYVMLSEIPKYAVLNKGDTVVTDFSSIFPNDVVIGTIDSYQLNQSNYYDVRVRLATDMTSLKKVLLVRYSEIIERMILEEEFLANTLR